LEKVWFVRMKREMSDVVEIGMNEELGEEMGE
jgi:hypothetical protein